MEKSLCFDLQKLQILVSFWQNQTIFALTGKNEIEKLGFGFAKRRETISAVDPEQKELLDILVNGNGNFAERLQIIWSKINLNFSNLLVSYSDKELCDYAYLVACLTEEIERNQKNI